MPKSGVLQVWYECEEQPWEKASSSVRVVWHPDSTRLQPIQTIPDEVILFNQIAVGFILSITVMNDEQMMDLEIFSQESFKYPSGNDDDDEYFYEIWEKTLNAIYELEKENLKNPSDYKQDEPCHQILGYPTCFQGQRVLPDHRLLFQIDTDHKADWIWGDTGILWIDILNKDLVQLEFDRACSEWACC